MAASPELQALVEAFCETAFAEPAEGLTLFAFFTRETHRSLEPDEVSHRLDDGRGAYVIELVYDEELELVERGQGRVVRSLDELVGLARARLRQALPEELRAVDGGGGRDPTLSATALPDDAGRGRPKPKTSIPWHPAAMDVPSRGKKKH